jgi:hypothetical protein
MREEFASQGNFQNAHPKSLARASMAIEELPYRFVKTGK